MQVGRGRFGPLELDLWEDSKGAKIGFNDALDGPETGPNRRLSDSAHRIVTVIDASDSFAFSRLALAHPEDLADLEGVKGGRFAVEIEAQCREQSRQQAAAHFRQFG